MNGRDDRLLPAGLCKSATDPCFDQSLLAEQPVRESAIRVHAPSIMATPGAHRNDARGHPLSRREVTPSRPIVWHGSPI